MAGADVGAVPPVERLPPPQAFDWESECSRLTWVLIDDVLGEQDKDIFLGPVTPDKPYYAAYHEAIERPVWLAAVLHRLAGHSYGTPAAYWRDMQLLFDNALVFNGEHSYVGQLALKLKKAFEREWTRSHALWLPPPPAAAPPPAPVAAPPPGGAPAPGDWESKCSLLTHWLADTVLGPLNKGIFYDPVPPDAPYAAAYAAAIARPVWLAAVLHRLAGHSYDTPAAYWRDMQLLFDNALAFNGAHSYVGQLALQLKKAFEREWATTPYAAAAATAHPLYVDAQGATALHRAARDGCVAAIPTLLDGGADVAATDMSVKTPLQALPKNAQRNTISKIV